MTVPLRALAFAGILAFSAACAQAPAAAPPTPAPTAPLPAATAAPQAQAQNPQRGERMEGAVQSASSDQVTLADGKSFKLAANTRIIRRDKAALSDFQSGQMIAITAKLQPDGVLLASVVNIFPSGFDARAGQFPMSGGNLMTNATLNTVDGNRLSVTFPGGAANVQLAPDVDLGRLVNLTPKDLTAGTKLTAQVADGVARFVNLQ